MKNWLNYYYNIDVDLIHQNNKNYFFEKDGYQYTFFQYYGDMNQLKEIYEFSNNLLNHGIYCHRIISNKDYEPATNIDGITYVLMVSSPNLDKKVELNDILNFSIFYLPNEKLRRDDWKGLWEIKIDYFEYQLNQFGNKHPIIKDSFGYFAGYVETGIALLNYVNPNIGREKNLFLSHKRLTDENNLFDLYNPFNFIIDYRIRDIAEYFKKQIFQKKNILEDIHLYLETANLEQYEIQLFFIRMLYPSFYFDVFEDIMNYDKDDEKIKKVLENTLEYEKFIKQLYQYIINIVNFPIIEWLRF